MGHFSKFGLLWQLFATKDFSMETRLCNIFQTANAITLVKTFQKALVKFSKVHEKGLFLKNPNNF